MGGEMWDIETIKGFWGGAEGQNQMSILNGGKLKLWITCAAKWHKTC
jgi:hypothetical protein